MNLVLRGTLVNLLVQLKTVKLINKYNGIAYNTS